MTPTTDLSDDEFGALARRALASPDAPTAWRERALAAWQLAQPAAAAVPPLPSSPSLPSFATLAGQALQAVGRRLAASLAFDSWATAPLATGRRSLRGDTRQLIFSVEGRDIDLRLTATGERFTLAGQVLGPDEAGSVTLALAPPAAGQPDSAEPSAAARSVALDTMGEFHLDDVAAGRYVMTLQLGDTEVTLPVIEVGAPSA